MNNKVDNLNKTRERLYREFLRVFKQSQNVSASQQRVCYAEMLEIIRKLIISCNIEISEVSKCAESQPISWYKQTISKEQAVMNSQKELLERFGELIEVESQEVFRDVVKELFVSFRGMVKSSGYSFKEVEMTRREQRQGVSSTTALAR